MRIQKLLRIFERVDPFWLIFLDKDLCGQILLAQENQQLAFMTGAFKRIPASATL